MADEITKEDMIEISFSAFAVLLKRAGGRMEFHVDELKWNGHVYVNIDNDKVLFEIVDTARPQ